MNIDLPPTMKMFRITKVSETDWYLDMWDTKNEWYTGRGSSIAEANKVLLERIASRHVPKPAPQISRVDIGGITLDL